MVLGNCIFWGILSRFFSFKEGFILQDKFYYVFGQFYQQREIKSSFYILEHDCLFLIVCIFLDVPVHGSGTTSQNHMNDIEIQN